MYLEPTDSRMGKSGMTSLCGTRRWLNKKNGRSLDLIKSNVLLTVAGCVQQ